MISRSLLYLSLGCFVIACQQNPESASNQPVMDGFSRKHEPVDANLDLRLGVRGDFSLKAYFDGLREATQSLSARSTPAGFDDAWEIEGPFTEGGRVNTLAIDPRDPNIVYVAFSRGGLWRSTNHGDDWQVLSDALPIPSIGCIAIDTITDRIWIGTGDPNITGYFFIGDGVYYSDDNGSTWTNSGLGETGIISDLKIDPRNPNVLYAATMGQPYAPDTNRGLYKSSNRGVSWNQILFDSTTAGISSIHLHPTNPDIIYATGWDRQRNLFSSIASGNHTKLWKSIDAGQTWTNLQPVVGYDMPSGRLGFAISQSDPSRLYLSVTDESGFFGGLYRSDNGGVAWTFVAKPDERAVTGLSGHVFSDFGWFFGQTRVDPIDANHLWMLGVLLWQSFDGGYTWTSDDDTEDFIGLHADKHALEISNDGHLWIGTDGGVYKRNRDSLDWIDTENLPTNLIYRVADNPFDTVSYACGMQDNGTSLGGELAAPEAWSDIYGGDGFQPVFSGSDDQTMVALSQYGSFWQIDLLDATASPVSPFETSERRNWDTPVASYYDSTLETTYLLTGSTIAHEGIYDVPPFWQSNEQQLTSRSGSRYYTITSAHIASDLTCYIGTSEGWIWKKQFLNGDWIRLNTGFAERYVTDITTAPDNPNVIYMTMSEYRNGNQSPYILRSADAGVTWNSLQGDMPQIAANSILSIPNTNDSMLMVATDAGVYGSLDRGVTYHRLGKGMTNIPVFDLAYDDVSTRLIAGTFGRSLQTYPLRKISELNTGSTGLLGPAFAKTKRELLVYPNPTNGEVCLEATLIEVSRGSKLDLLNLNGQVMQSWEFAAGQQKLKPCIEIKNQFANGPYIFRLKNRHDVQMAKVVLER